MKVILVGLILVLVVGGCAKKKTAGIYSLKGTPFCDIKRFNKKHEDCSKAKYLTVFKENTVVGKGKTHVGWSHPLSWWSPMSNGVSKRSWEISSDSVTPPQVILSKRNELGILSNFAATPFELNKKQYGSMEGFWQAMKYPEDENDPRFKLAKWPYTRAEVERMKSFKAKKAGDFGSKVMKKNSIDWVTFGGLKMKYREKGEGEFFKVIRRGMLAKLKSNPPVKKTLCSTGRLELLPDHSQGSNPPAAWKYHHIWMALRKEQCRQ